MSKGLLADVTDWIDESDAVDVTRSVRHVEMFLRWRATRLWNRSTTTTLTYVPTRRVSMPLVEYPDVMCDQFLCSHDPYRMLEFFWRHPAPETMLVLDVLGRHLPGRELAKQARDDVRPFVQFQAGPPGVKVNLGRG